MCDLIAALALMISMVAANCATTASELGLQPLHSNGQAYQSPLLLRLYDREGELRAEWVGRRYGLIGWTTQPELVIFNTTQYSTSYLIAGDPSDGRLYEVGREVGTLRWMESPTQARFSYWDGAYRERIVRLPAPLHERVGFVADTAAAGQLKVVDNMVQVDGRILLNDNGLPHSLFESPSGRWVLAVEDQLAWTPIIYAIAPDGSGRVLTVRTVDPAELPLERQQPEATSPNGQWTVFFRAWPWGILLSNVNGDRRLYRGSPVDGPWWSPDSRQFAYVDGRSLSVIDLEDRSQESESADVFFGGRAILSPAPQVFLGWMPHGLAWLMIGASDHNDHGLPPYDWRESFD